MCVVRVVSVAFCVLFGLCVDCCVCCVLFVVCVVCAVWVLIVV